MSTFHLGWATDLHLEQHSKEEFETFIEEVKNASLDSLLLTGDTSNSTRLIEDLNEIKKKINIPVFFICGNHDFYGSSIKGMRTKLKETSQSLFYLSHIPYVQLGKNCALIGHDSWSDGRCGNYLTTPIKTADSTEIEEFKHLNKEECWSLMKQLADEATDHFKKNLPKLTSKYERLIIAIHPPPFREACLYEGKIADDQWGPHFVSAQLGIFLEQIATKHPNNKFLVLCGHAHSGAFLQKKPNLTVYTGKVSGKPPILQKVIQLEEDD